MTVRDFHAAFDTSSGLWNMRRWAKPVTGPLTIDTTVGAERFIDEYGREWPLIGASKNFSAVFPPTKAEAVIAARRMAESAVTFTRIMAADEDPVWSDAYTWQRCSWWVNQSWPTGDFSASISATALDRFMHFVWCLKNEGIRFSWAFDDWGIISTGFGRAPGGVGSHTNYTFLGQMWFAQMLQDAKDYLTWLLNLYNPYTGLYLKDDPTFAMIHLFNEQSVGNAWGTGTFDSIVQLALSYLAELDADYSGWHFNKYGVVPFKTTSGDGWVKFPTLAYNDEGGGVRPLYASLSTGQKQAFALWTMEKQRWLNNALRTHIRSISPNMLVSGCTAAFGPYIANDGMDFQEYHSYAGVAYASEQPDPSNPATISSAVVSASGILTIVLANVFASHTAIVGRFVKLAGLSSPSSAISSTVLNGEWPLASVSGDKLTLTIDLSAYTTTAETLTRSSANAILAAYFVSVNGESRLKSNTTLGAYTAVGAATHLAGKPLVGLEQSNVGISMRDAEHFLTSTALGLQQGWSGWQSYHWGDNLDQYDEVGAINNASFEQHPGKIIALRLSALMMRFKSITPLANLRHNTVGETTWAVAAGASSFRHSPAWYADYNTSPVTMFGSYRMRQSVHPTTHSATGEWSISNSSPFTFGKTNKERLVSAPLVPTGGSDNTGERFECNDTSAGTLIAGVWGRVVNGTYGKVTISGLPAGGVYGVVLWHTLDGKPLNVGESVLACYGFAFNEGFKWCDANNNQYTGYSGPGVNYTGKTQFLLHDAVVTLAGAANGACVTQTVDGVVCGSVPAKNSGSDLVLRMGHHPLVVLRPRPASATIARARRR